MLNPIVLISLVYVLTGCNTKDSPVKPDSPLEQALENVIEEAAHEAGIDVQVDLNPEKK